MPKLLRRKSEGGKACSTGIDNWNLQTFVLNMRVTTHHNTRN